MIVNSWADNVGPLIELLEQFEINVLDWAAYPDVGEVEARLDNSDMQVDILRSAVHFACGYMQATGNLTGMSWEDQIKRHLESEKTNGE